MALKYIYRYLLLFSFQADFNAFFSEFVDLLKVCLVVGEKQPQVERCLSFVATFTCADKKLKEDKTELNKENSEEGLSAQELDKKKELSESSSLQEDMEEGDEEVDEFLIRMFQFLLNVRHIFYS